jgi:hypothetical protein
MTRSTTTTLSCSYSVGFTASGGLLGALTGTVGISGSWIQSSSTMYQDSLDRSVGEPNGGNAVCFDAMAQDGSYGDADTSGIYMWAPVSTACT